MLEKLIPTNDAASITNTRKHRRSCIQFHPIILKHMTTRPKTCMLLETFKCFIVSRPEKYLDFSLCLSFIYFSIKAGIHFQPIPITTLLRYFFSDFVAKSLGFIFQTSKQIVNCLLLLQF